MNIKPQKTQKPSQSREKKVPKRITETYLHNSGLYYLQRFATSSGHFRSVMLRKVKNSCRHHTDQNYEACAALVEALVEKFRTAGLLDDQAYTRGVVGSLRRQGKSKRAIITKLSVKGVPGALATETLNTHDSEITGDAELRAAVIFARRKKIGPYASDKNKNDPQVDKMLSSMGCAGFAYETARRVLRFSLKEAEEILEG